MFWCKNEKIKNWLPEVQSHRGYWVEGLPQNSLLSIQQSFKMKYSMVEFDVRLTRDKVAILFHDYFYLNKKVSLYTFSEISQLEKINTLEEILKWVQEQNNPNYKLNIELKSNVVFDNQLEEIVIGLIQKYQLQKQVIISSFNPFSLMRVRFLNKDIFRALLLTYEKVEGNYWFLKKRIFNFLAFPHALNLWYQDWIDGKINHLPKDIPVVLWTLNDMQIYKSLSRKVHGVITDRITPSNN